MQEWVNKNSNGMVDIKVLMDNFGVTAYIAFERYDDATFFKIKFSV
jgi:hypothetical protein